MKHFLFVFVVALAGCANKSSSIDDSVTPAVDPAWRDRFWESCKGEHSSWPAAAWEKILRNDRSGLSDEQSEVCFAGWESTDYSMAQRSLIAASKARRDRADAAGRLAIEQEDHYREIVKDGVKKDSFKAGTPEEQKYWDSFMQTWPGGVTKSEERALRDGYIWAGMDSGYAFAQLDRWYPNVKCTSHSHPGYEVFIVEGTLDSFTMDTKKRQLASWSFRNQ